jgi:hypothetical protein
LPLTIFMITGRCVIFSSQDHLETHHINHIGNSKKKRQVWKNDELA